VLLFGTYLILYKTTTDVMKINYYNGFAVYFEYYEEWTEEQETCTTDSDGSTSCTTYDVYHSPYYQTVTTNKEVIKIRKRNWLNARSAFGAREVNLYRSGQVSHGDGDKYVAQVVNTSVPTAVAWSEINYINATQNILRKKSYEKKFNQYKKAGLLKEYPKNIPSKYGYLNINRVLGNVHVSSTVKTLLDNTAGLLGKAKEVNPILYVVKGTDRSFKHVLESYWRKGGKNDAILILGVNDKGIVEWSDTIAWTKNVDFLINATNIYEGMEVNNELVKKFSKEILTHFERTPMESLSYLSRNISLPWWAQALVLLLNLVGSFFLFRKLMEN